MVANLKLTQTQIEKWLKKAIIIIDKREQNCDGIIAYFDKKGIKYVRQSLDFCDYSIMLPKDDELGIPFDMSFEKQVAVELKHSSGFGLNELAGNFTEGRNAFENEFIKSMPSNCRVFLVCSTGSWDDIESHNYHANFSEKAFYNSLLSFEWKYNIHTHFISENRLGEHIYRILIVALKKILQ